MFETLKHLLERYDEGDGSEIALNIIFVSLISSDTLLTLADCKKSRNSLNVFKESVNSADIGNETKSYWLKTIDEGFEILNETELSLNDL